VAGSSAADWIGAIGTGGALLLGVLVLSREQRDRRRAQARRRRAKRRRLIVLAALTLGGAGAFLAGAVIGEGGVDGSGTDAAEDSPAALAELPRGGRDLLPRHTLVGFYGAPQDDELGALGVGSPAEASERLARLVRAGQAVRVARNLHFSPEPLAEIEAQIIAICEREGQATIAGVRDELGTSRRYAQALLEHLDAAKLTVRRGDAHVLRRRRSTSLP